MSEGLLVRYMAAGFPHLREKAELPRWLLPGLAEDARRLGEESLLKLAEPLGLAERLKTGLSEAPEPDSLPIEKWLDSIGAWQGVHQVTPVILALLQALEKIEALQRRGTLEIDSSLVRGIAVMAYANFAEAGHEILERLSVVLGVSNSEPVGLLERYLSALTEDDRKVLSSVDDCIQEDPIWAEWAQRFIAIGKSSPLTPGVISISPGLNPDLTRILVSMMEELLQGGPQDADRGRNNPEGKGQNRPAAT